MTMTAIILIILIAGALLYTVYDEAVIPFLKGKTYLSVRLRKRSYLDELLFAGFLIVAFISNLLHGGSGTNNVLLLILTVIFLYYTFGHAPKARFKEKGFFNGLLFTDYNQMKNMRLSEDGVLVIDTDKRRIFLYARRIEDLEKISKVLLEH